jgi:hypothetical protein
MGDGELPRLLREPDSLNFLPFPVAILRGSAIFWNELEGVSHYVGKHGMADTFRAQDLSSAGRNLWSIIKGRGVVVGSSHGLQSN